MTIAHSFTEIDEGVWKKACDRNVPQSPFSTISWHTKWFEILGAHYSPFIGITEDVIIPLAREENTLTFSGGHEVADYMDAIGEDKQKPKAWRQLASLAKNEGVTDFFLPNVPENSSTLNFFTSLEGSSIQKDDSTPIVHLPSSWDSYIESLDRHNRHEVKRKLKKFEREHPDTSIVQLDINDESIASLFRLMESDAAKKKFLTPPVRNFFSAITTKLHSTSRILQLKNMGDLVAAILEFIDGGQVYLYNSGFDEKHFSGAGFYLKSKALQRAISEGYRTYNFLQGQERYKYELGAKDFLVYTVTAKLT